MFNIKAIYEWPNDPKLLLNIDNLFENIPINGGIAVFGFRGALNSELKIGVSKLCSHSLNLLIVCSLLSQLFISQ